MILPVNKSQFQWDAPWFHCLLSAETDLQKRNPGPAAPYRQGTVSICLPEKGWQTGNPWSVRRYYHARISA